MRKSSRRNPRGYDGTETTSRQIGDVLPGLMSKMNRVSRDQPHLILNAWPEVIGQRLASMTKADSFTDGVLFVKVANSTLHSLLSQHDKKKILANLRKRFPNSSIRNIMFRIG